MLERHCSAVQDQIETVCRKLDEIRNQVDKLEDAVGKKIEEASSTRIPKDLQVS